MVCVFLCCIGFEADLFVVPSRKMLIVNPLIWKYYSVWCVEQEVIRKLEVKIGEMAGAVII